MNEQRLKKLQTDTPGYGQVKQKVFVKDFQDFLKHLYCFNNRFKQFFSSLQDKSCDILNPSGCCQQLD